MPPEKNHAMKISPKESGGGHGKRHVWANERGARAQKDEPTALPRQHGQRASDEPDRDERRRVACQRCHEAMMGSSVATFQSNQTIQTRAELTRRRRPGPRPR